MKWFIYIVQCTDKSLYTGITIDIERRVKQHNEHRGSKILRGKTPVKLVYTEEIINRSEATKREYIIKQLSRQEKMSLIEQYNLGR